MYTLQDYQNRIHELEMYNQKLIALNTETVLQWKESIAKMEGIYKEVKSIYREGLAEIESIYKKQLAEKESEITLLKAMHPVAN